MYRESVGGRSIAVSCIHAATAIFTASAAPVVVRNASDEGSNPKELRSGIDVWDSRHRRSNAATESEMRLASCEIALGDIVGKTQESRVFQ